MQTPDETAGGPGISPTPAAAAPRKRNPRTRTSRARAIRTLASLTGVGGLILLSCVAGGPVAAADGSSSATAVPAAPVVSTAQGNQEAAAVADEDRRLIELRAVTATSQVRTNYGQSPYRVNTGSDYTLVLTARTTPYTLSDLLQLEPETLLLQPDGSYLLKENIYVERGATLYLSSTAGLTLKLLSDSDGFASIVSYGGDIIVTGSQGHPVTVESWNPQNQAVQTDLTNGRAYIRAIGGQMALSYVDANALGFWSGDTGGIALTGTTRPSAGSTSFSGTATKTTKINSNQVSVSSLDNPDLSALFTVPGMSFVSAKIDHVQVSGDAFGLYFSTAQGVVISNSVITGSLVEGIVLHRLTTEVEIQSVISNQNVGPGFDVSRAAQQVQILDCTADYNQGNGFTVNGQPISQGASASGEPLGSYGDNSITSSNAQGNAHYGIEVQGGVSIALNGNTIIGNQMGIVVTKATNTITISHNTLEQQNRQGISLIDGVTKAAVTSNTVQGAATGIYVRDSVVELADNTVSGASLHAVTMIGPDAGSVVQDNTLDGAGVSAIDTHRVTGSITLGSENTVGWDDTTPLLKRITAMIRPLTIIWLCIFTVLVVAAYRNWRTQTGRGKRHDRRRAVLAPGRHPYTNQLILAAGRTMTLDEVLAASERKMMQARAEKAAAKAKRATNPDGRPTIGGQWRPAPAAPQAAETSRARHGQNGPAPVSASAETALLPVIEVPESVRAPRETLVRVGHGDEPNEASEDSLAFPSLGDLTTESRRARARTSMTEGPSAGGELDERQW